MLTEQNLLEITDTAVKDISQRVAKLDMQRTEIADIDSTDSSSLVIVADGHYPLTLVLYAGKRVLRAIGEHMKREEIVDDDEISIYTTEFFNILCGHVITMLNNRSHTETRFGIPHMQNGLYSLLPPNRLMQKLFYHSCYGSVVIYTFCRWGCPIE